MHPRSVLTSLALSIPIVVGALACSRDEASADATDEAQPPDLGGAAPGEGRSTDPFAGIEALHPEPWAAWPVEYVDPEVFAGWRISPTTGKYERREALRLRVDAGAFVLAIADGKVIAVEAAAGEDPGEDPLFVTVDHGQGIESRLGPLSEVGVHPHLPVTRGTQLGLAAGRGLELSVSVDGVAIDPLLALRQPLYRWPAQLRRLPAGAL